MISISHALLRDSDPARGIRGKGFPQTGCEKGFTHQREGIHAPAAVAWAAVRPMLVALAVKTGACA